MRIWRVHALEGIGALQLDDTDSLIPGPGEVRIKVHAAGVNFADTLITRGQYQEKPELPFGPGAEVAGEVLDWGAGVAGFAEGERVFATTVWGGYAEEAVVSADSVWPVPSSMDFETAGAFPIAYGTSHIALDHKARLKVGETLVVHGASGGVGLTAVEIGKAMGARVIATASSAEKLEVARSRGADAVINTREEDLRARMKELTDGKGADVVFDPVGGDVFDASLRAVNFEGRIVVIGFASGKVPQIPANYLLVKTVDVLGLNWGGFRRQRPDAVAESFAKLLAWFEDGKIRPLISGVYDFDDVPEAIAQVAGRKATGKVVVRIR